jgi:hypothetical protein
MVMANTLTLAMNVHFVSVLLVSVKHHRLELKKQHFVAIPPFPYYKLIEKKKKKTLSSSMLSFHVLCFVTRWATFLMVTTIQTLKKTKQTEEVEIRKKPTKS